MFFWRTRAVIRYTTADERFLRGRVIDRAKCFVFFSLSIFFLIDDSKKRSNRIDDTNSNQIRLKHFLLMTQTFQKWKRGEKYRKNVEGKKEKQKKQKQEKKVLVFFYHRFFFGFFDFFFLTKNFFCLFGGTWKKIIHF